MRFGGNFVWKTNLTLIFAQCSAKAVESKFGVNYEIHAFAGMTLRVSQSMSIYALFPDTLLQGCDGVEGRIEKFICKNP